MNKPQGRVGINHFPLTIALALAAGVMSGFGGSGLEIPKPNEPLARRRPSLLVEESVLHIRVSAALNDIVFAADAAGSA